MEWHIIYIPEMFQEIISFFSFLESIREEQAGHSSLCQVWIQF